jgi:hypothetical protein
MRQWNIGHSLAPSPKKGQLFDIFIYLQRHRSTDFSDVTRAEFFVGPYWGKSLPFPTKAGLSESRRPPTASFSVYATLRSVTVPTSFWSDTSTSRSMLAMKANKLAQRIHQRFQCATGAANCPCQKSPRARKGSPEEAPKAEMSAPEMWIRRSIYRRATFINEDAVRGILTKGYQFTSAGA